MVAHGVLQVRKAPLVTTRPSPPPRPLVRYDRHRGGWYVQHGYYRTACMGTLTEAYGRACWLAIQLCDEPEVTA
jgi:hypothetical protein